MLSSLVITFLPRSKHLLISWGQIPSAVILEPPKINSLTVSIVSPTISHEVMGPDAMILVFWMLSLNQSLPPGNFHKPLILLHQRADRLKTTISCLTISNLPWFMDLTFQVPMQYCSLQHWVLLSQPDISTTKHQFCFSPVILFPLELLVIALCSFPVAYCTLSNLGSSPTSVHIFLPFHTVHGVLQARIWSGLPFPAPVGHILWKLFTMTHSSWLALHCMSHSFIQPFHHDKAHTHDRDKDPLSNKVT